METTTHTSIATLAGICRAKGITQAVISPGSRNAPLSIAFNRQKGIDCHVVVDERCAGFVSLGMAQKTQTAVAVICTSGTAVLNLAPAVAEACYQQIPLIVITADRPQEMIDQEDSQTIRQNEIFRNFVKGSFTLPSGQQTSKSGWHTSALINNAIETATALPAGPVHINVPTDEPLYQTTEADNNSIVKNTILIQPSALGQRTANNISRAFQSKNIMILAGHMPPCPELNTLVNNWARHSNVAVMAEALSNLRGEHIHNRVEAFFAKMLDGNDTSAVPDVLIVMGGALVSKSAKTYFRKNKPAEVWRVSPHLPMADTFSALTQAYACTPLSFFDCIFETQDSQSSRFGQAINQLLPAYIPATQWSEEAAMEIIMKALPPHSDLHLSNGTSVRVGQNVPCQTPLNLYANRGTSGIDGCTSTAVGSATMNQGGITTLVTGDLCFFYDSNALWNSRLPQNLKIFVMNNHGGGIFSRMKGPHTVPEYEKYFITPHTNSIEHLSKAFGQGNITYCKANNQQELTTAADMALKSDTCCIVEVNLP